MQAMTESTRDPDLRELFRLLAAGREPALAELYGACSDGLYGLALWRTGSAEDAADVVQEVFVRLVEARDRLAGVSDPLSYLRRMTHRASIDVHRRRSRRREDSIDLCSFVAAIDSDPERRLDARRVSSTLTTLPPAQREAIYLRHFAGCSFSEIGRATGVPTFTAASRYRIGIKRLRRLHGVQP
jgi:RNA polymerase sigma-70 factor (ECF subfamily)